MRYYNTVDGHVYRRNAANSAWIDEGLVDSLGNAATVTQQLAGTATDAFSTPDSVAALWQRGTDIASSGTLSLPSTGGGVFNVTGTTTITGIGSASGGRGVWLRFSGALTFTHNGTSLILPGAANITTVSGDCAYMVNEAAADATGSNWRCFAYLYADGRFPAYTSSVATQAQMETATATTVVVTPGRQQYHPGVAKCWGSFDFTSTALASHNILSVADTGTGRSTPTIATDFSSANWACVVSVEQGAQPDRLMQFTSKAAGTVELTSYDISGAALADSAQIDFVGFGDQA